MAEMLVRLAKQDDLSIISEIYESARGFMRRSGNPTQWGETHPPMQTLIEDIRARRLFVIEREGRVCGVFAFILGEDPTYLDISGGSWLNSEPYGVIHRIAGDGKTHGVLYTALRFASGIVRNIRIDTHENNAVMRRKLEAFGFKYCGIIHVADGTPRLAYHYVAGTPSRAELLSSVAPCSLCCMTCPGFRSGEVAKRARALHTLFEGYYDFNDANIPAEYRSRLDEFKEFDAELSRYTSASCPSCREIEGSAAGCIENCYVRLCYKQKGVDFCADCPDFPCGAAREFFDGINAVIASDWEKGSRRIREIGAEAYYAEKKNVSHYISYKKPEKQDNAD